jgi:hypothetical protein
VPKQRDSSHLRTVDEILGLEVREYSGGAAHVLVIQRFLREARKGFLGCSRPTRYPSGRFSKAQAPFRSWVLPAPLRGVSGVSASVGSCTPESAFVVVAQHP